MWEWLLSSIDPSRGHEVGVALSWHARLMTLAWGVIAPTAVFAARFLKILPWQRWPAELDNKTWWRGHLWGQSVAYALSLVGLGLIWMSTGNPSAPLHTVLGYVVLGLGTLQVALGVFRGTKGGPTAPAPDGSPRGDHYDMTPWRLMFERVHKSLGYLALALGAVTILSGMWSANAPIWMWITIPGYWALLGGLSAYCQARGFSYDTYQAIWGPDPSLPGNKMRKMGLGTVRPSECMERFNKAAE